MSSAERSPLVPSDAPSRIGWTPDKSSGRPAPLAVRRAASRAASRAVVAVVVLAGVLLGAVAVAPASAATTYPVKGGIATKYGQGTAKADLGKPTMAEKCGLIRDGCYQNFEHGIMYWSPASHAHYVKGGIRTKFAAMGFEKGKLGYPTGEEVKSVKNGIVQQFENGAMYWTASAAAHPVLTGMKAQYKKQDWERGYLGYPSADEKCSTNCTQAFQGGSLTWVSGSSATCAVSGVSADQVVWVRSSGTKATISACQKRADGKYGKVLGDYSGFVGTQGAAVEKKEGDGKTPKGVFGLGDGYGVQANPGLHKKWTVVKKGYVWVDDPASSKYNTFQTSGKGESLYVIPQYNIFQVIGYNTARVKGKGSAIFLHVSVGGPTAGCVSLPQASLTAIMRWETASATQIKIQ